MGHSPAGGGFIQRGSAAAGAEGEDRGTAVAKAAAMVMAHGAAVVADDAVAKDGVAVAIIAGDDALAIHGGAAGAAVVREAADGSGAMAVAVKGMRSGRSEDCKTGGDCQEGDELFHDLRRFVFLICCRFLAACS